MKIFDKIQAVMNGHNGELFSSADIKNMALKAFPGTNRGSVVPSDYCYNMVNKGIVFDKRDRIFEQIDGGYKYLGLDYDYVGRIYWKGQAVGEWKAGVKAPHFWRYVGN